MRHYLFQGCLLIGYPGENSNSCGPHHDTLRNQIHTGKHQTDRTEYSLRNRIPKESGIGADNGIFQTFQPVLIFFMKKKITIKQGYKLYANRNHRNPRTVRNDVRADFCHKTGNDVRRENQVNDQIGNLLLSPG